MEESPSVPRRRVDGAGPFDSGPRGVLPRVSESGPAQETFSSGTTPPDSAAPTVHHAPPSRSEEPGSQTSGLVIELHECHAAMSSLLDRWTDLYRSSHAAPFCEPRAWHAWLTAFSDLRPAVYELRREGETLAILPLVRKGRRLEMAAGPHLDYQDLASVDPDSAIFLLDRVLEVEAARGSYLIFPKVASTGLLSKVLQSPLIERRAHLERRFWSRCPFVEIPSRPGQPFLSSLTTRQRKDYRNAGRRLGEALPGHVVEHHGPGGLNPGLIREIARLHRENQYRKSGESVFESPSFLAFLEKQSENGTPLCLSLLREEPGTPPIAFVLGYFANDVFYYYITSYSGRHAELSPGRWLLVESLLRWSALLKGKTLRFDLLCGEEGYKSRWATDSYVVDRVVLIPKRLRNLPRIVAYSAVYGLKNGRNRLLGRNTREPALETGGESIALPG